MAPTKERIEEAWDDTVNVGQGHWQEWKEKWDNLKDMSQEKILEGQEAVKEKLKELKEAGQERVHEGMQKVNEMTPEIKEKR